MGINSPRKHPPMKNNFTILASILALVIMGTTLHKWYEHNQIVQLQEQVNHPENWPNSNHKIAAQTLGKMGTTKTVQFLFDQLINPDGTPVSPTGEMTNPKAHLAIEGLEEIESTESAPLLIQIASGENPKFQDNQIRILAIGLLGLVGQENKKQALVKIQEDPNSLIAGFAKQAITQVNLRTTLSPRQN